MNGGACKLQWKADWAMRWYALDVDYEMSGKDLIDCVRLSGPHLPHPRQRRRRRASPMNCSSTSTAQKISKSKGNGLSVEEWLRYAPPESLAQFMFNAPQRAKRLYFDVIPRAVDEYLANAAKAHGAAGGRADGSIRPGTSMPARVPQPRAAARSRSACC